MTTIIDGNPEVLKKTKYFRCRTCGWVGTADKGEYKYEDEYCQYATYFVTCPCCKNRAYEKTEKEINEILKKYGKGV
jgi:hypothetical protein